MDKIFVDETGTPEEEQIIGYGGILTNEKQRIELEDYHREISQEFFPAGLPNKFAFHAYEIYKGKGHFSIEAGFTPNRRIELLRRLLGFRVRSDVTCIMSFQNKNTTIRKIESRSSTASLG